MNRNVSDLIHRSQIKDEFHTEEDNDTQLINATLYADLRNKLPKFSFKCIVTNKNKQAFLREMYVSKALEAVVLICSDAVPRTYIEQYVVTIIHKQGVASTVTVSDISNENKLMMESKGFKEDADNINERVKNNLIKEQFKYAHRNCSIIEKIDDAFKRNIKNESTLFWLSYFSAVPGDVSAVWLVSLANFDLSYCFSVEIRSIMNTSFLWQCDLHQSKQESLIHVDTDIHKILTDNIRRFVSNSTLLNDLHFVRNLLEMDPMNKYSLIDIVSLLRLISPLESREEILDILINRLPYIDNVYSKLYFDAASKFILECHLISLQNSHLRNVSLSNHGLTYICYLSWMTLMTDIDLSRNHLTVIPSLFSHYLLCLTKLNLSKNLLVSLMPLKGLRSLLHLDVSHNSIANFQDLEPVLYCIKLVYLNIKGNPVSQLPNLTNLVTDHATSRLHIGSLSIVYDKNL